MKRTTKILALFLCLGMALSVAANVRPPNDVGITKVEVSKKQTVGTFEIKAVNSAVASVFEMPGAFVAVEAEAFSRVEVSTGNYKNRFEFKRIYILACSIRQCS